MSTKRKLPGKLGLPQVQPSAKALGTGNLDESGVVVTGGGNATKANGNGMTEVVNISSDSSSEQEQDGEEDGHEDDESAEEDVAMVDAHTSEREMEEAGEPSFGDLIRANADEHIDVAGAFEEDRALTYSQGTQIQPPSGASLGTVLTQALKTNDVSLLESCLHTSDTNTIKATIQRLDSTLAGTLLQKLAERLHRRPGRSGSLMVWVQWTLVTHGGYLATQKDLIKKLAQLNRVIDERAKGLSSLLSLKGKLDMLEAQMELRKSMQRRRVDDDEEDEGVIYVEDQESEDEGIDVPKKLVANGISDFSGSDESEDMPNTNGVIADSEDDEEDSSGGEGMLDDEAEETDADTGDEDEVDFDDEDSDGEDGESDDDAPPPKMPRVSGMNSKKR